MPSFSNHTDSLIGLCILLLLMLSFRLLFVSHLCLIFIWLPWKIHWYLPIWTVIQWICHWGYTELVVALCLYGMSFFLWDKSLKGPDDTLLLLGETIYRGLRAQTLFTSLSATVNGLSREHWIKCWCLFPFLHPIPPCAAGIWKPVYNPAFPVSVARSPAVMRELKYEGFASKGMALSQLQLSVVILTCPNLIALLTCRGCAIWVAVPKDSFWMIRGQVNEGASLKLAVLGLS